MNAGAPPGQLGVVNGVGQAVGALVRGAAPLLAGLEWALFLALGGRGHQFGAWACVAATALLGVALYKCVAPLAAAGPSPQPDPSPPPLSSHHHILRCRRDVHLHFLLSPPVHCCWPPTEWGGVGKWMVGGGGNNEKGM